MKWALLITAAILLTFSVFDFAVAYYFENYEEKKYSDMGSIWTENKYTESDIKLRALIKTVSMVGYTVGAIMGVASFILASAWIISLAVK